MLTAEHTTAKGYRKSPYLLGIAAATLGFVLSPLEPAIHGPKLWTIFLCASLAVFVSVLKLRNLWLGSGWIFPGTNAALLAAVVVEVWLHLWFSH
jgi:hypothetical protein